MEVGEEGDYYTYRYTVTTRMTPEIKMGSDESHFNVSLIVRNKVTRQCPQTTIFEVKGEPKRIRTEVPLLTSLTPNRLTPPPCVDIALLLGLFPEKQLIKFEYC